LCIRRPNGPDTAQLPTASFGDYALPRAGALARADVLPAIEVKSNPVAASLNPLGAKGAGDHSSGGSTGAGFDCSCCVILLEFGRSTFTYETRGPSMSLHPQITHVGLNTPNLETMREFYGSVLGLVVTDKGFAKRLGVNICFMSANPDNHHQIVLIESKAPSNVQQLSFKVGTLSDLRQMRDRLKAAGRDITPVDHGNAWSVYSSDPDGNGVEIYLDSPWQVAQPHGRPLDLDQSDEAIHRATEAAIKDDPTFQPVKVWQDAFVRKLQ